MKCIFCTKFFNGFLENFNMRDYAANRVTNMLQDFEIIKFQNFTKISRFHWDFKNPLSFSRFHKDFTIIKSKHFNVKSCYFIAFLLNTSVVSTTKSWFQYLIYHFKNSLKFNFIKIYQNFQDFTKILRFHKGFLISINLWK